MRIHNLALLLAGFTLAVPAAWAGVTSCASSANGNSVSSYAPTSSTDGCASVDINYTNISLTGTSQTGHGTLPTSGNLDIYSTGSGPVNLYLDGFAAINGSGSENATFGFVATANTDGSLHWAYTSLTLQADGVSVSPGAGVSITETFCLDASQSSVGGNCRAADQGTLTAHYTSGGASFTCSFGTAGVCLSGTSDEASFAHLLVAPTSVAVSEVVNVTSYNSWVQFSNVDNSFGMALESPEPESFALVGAALIALGMIGLRRKN